MQTSNRFLKIYGTSLISLVINFASMYIIIPILSEDKLLFGIYSLCTSFIVFFSYSDFGLIAASQRALAEYFSKKESHNYFSNIRLLFLSQGLVAVGFIAFFVVLSLFPQIVVGGSTKHENLSIASEMFFILAISTPAYLLNKVTQTISSSMLKDYVFSLFIISNSLFRILTAILMNYLAVFSLTGFFWITQLSTVVFSIVAILYVLNSVGFSVKDAIAGKNDYKNTFKLLRGSMLAAGFSSLLSIFFFEFDQLIIAKFFNLEAVAVYAIAFSIASIIRTVNGMLFSPIGVKITQVVYSDTPDFKNYFSEIVSIYFPVLMIILAIPVTFGDEIIVLWVGNAYKDSYLLLILLSLTWIFNFFAQPLSSYIFAIKKNLLYSYASFALVFFFYCSLILLYSFLPKNVALLPISKIVAVLISFIIYFYFAVKLDVNLSFKTWSKIILTTFALIVYFVVVKYLYTEFWRVFVLNSFSGLLIYFSIIVLLILGLLLVFSNKHLQLLKKQLVKV